MTPGLALTDLSSALPVLSHQSYIDLLVITREENRICFIFLISLIAYQIIIGFLN